jgi:hypothetical protein
MRFGADRRPDPLVAPSAPQRVSPQPTDVHPLPDAKHLVHLRKNTHSSQTFSNERIGVL